MKIERAIERLERLAVDRLEDSRVYPEERQAVKLGIEALKKWQEWRAAPYIHGVLSPLPGETEEK